MENRVETIEQIEKIFKEYAEKYKQINEANTNGNEIINNIEYAIETLEKDGNLQDQIDENKKIINILDLNSELRSKDIISVMSFYADKKAIEERNASLSEIDELLNQINKDMTVQEKIKYLRNHEKEIAAAMKEDAEKQKNNIKIIDNIKDVCKERITEIENKKESLDLVNKNVGPAAEKIIEEVKAIENDLNHFALFRNAGILTHAQTQYINDLIRRQEVLSEEFLRILGDKTFQGVIPSFGMEKRFHEFKTYMEEKEKELQALGKIETLEKIIESTENIINNYVEPVIPEIKEVVVEEKKEEVKEEAKPKLEIDDEYAKQFPYLFNGIDVEKKETKMPNKDDEYFKQFPYLFAGLEDEKKEEVKEEKHEEINTNIEEQKQENNEIKEETKEEIKENDSLAKGYEAAMEFIRENSKETEKGETPKVDAEPEYDDDIYDDMFDNVDAKNTEEDKYQEFDETPVFDDNNIEEDKTEELKPVEEQPSSLDNTKENEDDYIYRFIDPNPIFTTSAQEEYENSVENHEPIYEETTNREELIKEDEPKIGDTETVDMSSQFDAAIDNNKQEEKNEENTETRDALDELIAEAMSDLGNPEPEEEKEDTRVFSKIKRKIKRKKSEKDCLKDKADTLEQIQKINSKKEENEESRHVRIKH